MLHENRESSHEIIEIRNVIVVAKKTILRMYQAGNTQSYHVTQPTSDSDQILTRN